VENPISSDQSLLRMSLLPGMRKNILENSRNFESFRLFEIGREIHRMPEGLPDEVPHLVAAIASRDSGEAALFELKRVAECLLEGAEAAPVEARGYEHPARSAGIVWREKTVGRLFEFHPSLIAPGRAAALDLDLRQMEALLPEKQKYRPIRRFPSSAFDLSVITGARDLVGGLERRLVSLAGDRLERIEFLRQYSGPPIPEGNKSVSFRLTVGSADHTLSSEEVADIRARIIEGMRAAGYDLTV
jgi:phenylalanyl-tRNA synthetase beta chain